MAVTATTPPLTELPSPPLPSDAEAIFDAKAGASLTAQVQMVAQINVALSWQADSMAATLDYKNAAGASATQAALAASTASQAKDAAQAAVTAAGQAGATQVALAVSARNDAQAAATAAGAAAGLPANRPPFAVLQINAAGNVGWGYGGPDTALATIGQALILGPGKVPKWGYAGPQIGDVLTTARDIQSTVAINQRVLPSSTAWYSVAYGNGKFVAIDANGAAATSPDGITWTAQVLPVTTNWISLTFGNGVFVAIAYGNAVAATSTDGITWTQRALPSAKDWRSVTFGNGLFVAVADASAVAATSPDGVTWTARALPVSYSWQAVGFGNGLFVAVGSGTVTATSPDGITWTQRTIANGTWVSVAYGSGLFVAVGSGSVLLTSPDGVTWTPRTIPSVTWAAVAYGNGTFFAVSGTATAISSVDGITWVQRDMPVTGNWKSVVYGTVGFVAVARVSAIAATINTASEYLLADGSIRSQSAYSALYALVGLIGGTYAVSWAQAAAGLSTTGGYVGASESGTVIAFTPSNATMRRSVDRGLTWSTVTLGTAALPSGSIETDGLGNWMMISSTLNVVLVSSDDGLTWTQKTMPSNGSSSPWGAIYCVGPGTFMANYAGSGYPLIRTTDSGTTWTSSTSGMQVNDIASDRAGTVIIAASNGIFKSTNGGASFGASIFAPANAVSAIAADKAGMWFMYGNTATSMYISRDNGATWSLTVNATAQTALQSAALYYDNVFLFVVAAGEVWEMTKLGVSSRRANQPVASRRLNNAGKGVFVSANSGATTINRSAPTYSYDPATQFALPSVVSNPVGLRSYIKALEAA
jgi:hypothetical protein